MKNIIELIESHSLLFLLLSIMCSYVLHIITDFNLQGILADLKQKNGGKKTIHRNYIKMIGWRL